MQAEVDSSVGALKPRRHLRARACGRRMHRRTWSGSRRVLSSYLGATLLLACSTSEPTTSIGSSTPDEEERDSSERGQDAGSDGARASAATGHRDAQSAPAHPDASSPGRAEDPPPTVTDHTCGGASYRAQGKELEIFVLFDNSISMLLPAVSWDCLTGASDVCTQTETGFPPTLWEVAVNELKTFVNDPASSGISLAMKYFGTDCSAATYATPDVPLGSLPERAAAITQSLDNTLPLEETATRPALEGALQFLRTRAEEPGYNARQVIVIVTDGMPDEFDCEDNTTASVSRVAAQAFSAAAPIPTYVFVTAPDLPLDEIAIAGGTEKALPADLSQPGALATALTAVRDSEVAALPCEYDLPAEFFTEVKDPSLVNLTRNGEPVGAVPGAAECGDGIGGWYYDDPADPSRILACPATCDNLKSGGSVDILLECPTITLL